MQDISKELGVRYVLEGSVRKSDNQVRITAQLVDATTGGHLWSERYDRSLQKIFALQDEIRQKIVTALKVKLTKEEQERFRQAPTNNLEAYDYYLRGLEAYWLLTKEANVRARQMWEKALVLDPQYAAVYAWLSRTYSLEWSFSHGAATPRHCSGQLSSRNGLSPWIVLYPRPIRPWALLTCGKISTSRPLLKENESFPGP